MREGILGTIKEERRLYSASVLIVTILTVCAGMMVYFVMQRQSEDFLKKGLEVVREIGGRVEAPGEKILERGDSAGPTLGELRFAAAHF